MTSGREMAIQASVMLETECDHCPGELVGGATAEVTAAAELDTARFVSDFAGGEPLRSGELGEGDADAVELRKLLRGELLVGEASGGGNSEG